MPTSRRRHRRAHALRWVALLSCGLALAGCNPVLTIFDAPAAVLSGTAFVVRVGGRETSTMNGGGAACVLQLPPGFALVGHGQGTRNDPIVRGSYTAEPGHALECLSGVVSGTFGTSTHYVVRAPAVPGTYVLKVALCGVSSNSIQPSSPAVTNFASITGGPHLRTIVVQTDPAGSFSLDPQSPARCSRTAPWRCPCRCRTIRS